MCHYSVLYSLKLVINFQVLISKVLNRKFNLLYIISLLINWHTHLRIKLVVLTLIEEEIPYILVATLNFDKIEIVQRTMRNIC